MTEPRDSGSDAKLKVGELDGMTQMLASQFREFRNEVKIEMAQLREEIRQRTTPKPMNVIGVIGVTVAVCTAIGGLLTWSLGPIRKDAEVLNRRLDSEIQALERRVTADIDSNRRAIETFKESINRELTWNFANQKLQHEATGRNLEKVWARVFATDMPAFQQQPKPPNP